MGKVIAPQYDHSKDISGVQVWGDLHILRNLYVFPDQIEEDGRIPAPVRRILDEAAQDFDPEEDFVLLIGDHVQVVYFVAEITRRYGRFRMLRYDKKADGYYPIFFGEPAHAEFKEFERSYIEE